MRGTYMPGARWLVTWLACCVGLISYPALAAGDNPPLTPEAGDSSSLLTNPLVIAGSPNTTEQLRAQEKARRANPVARAEREASRTKFQGLDGEQARQEAATAFPSTINEPSGGPPRLPAGQSIVGYPRSNVAQVDLGGGKQGLIESTGAMAVEASPGQREPLDLSLNHVGNGFEPARSVADVTIPAQLANGVKLLSTGVSLTPVDARGVPLGGAEGAVDGASVIYTNTQTDSDTVVKPTSDGFEADVLLRSVDSPNQLYFRVGLPEGAGLVQSGKDHRYVEVMDAGKVIAVIPTPNAVDAAGTPVPVAMNVTGDMLELKAGIVSGGYQYPIEIDPGVYDSTSSQEPTTNWHFIHEGSQFTAEEKGKATEWRWTEHIGAGHKVGEWGALAYTTQGDSFIMNVSIYGAWAEKSSHLENLLEIVSPSKVAESKSILPEESAENNGYSISSPEEKGGQRAAGNNSAEYLTESNGEGSGGENTLNSAAVEIDQETYPAISFNTTSSTVDGQPNVMYGSNNWLGPKSGAAEFTAEDRGIGVGRWWTEYSNTSGEGFKNLSEKNLITSGLCSGLQCPLTVKEFITYNSLLPNGESKLGLQDSNYLGGSEHEAESLKRHKVKVDALPPSTPTITGLGSGNEIAEGEYTLKGEAIDSLSGVKSISLTIDGREIGKPNGFCSGACTAKSEWQISGGESGVGEHKLVVTATDNAGNVAKYELTFKVRHAAPVSLGPGSVNPQSGEFTLSATDATVSAPGANLGVTRDYRSRHLAAGAEGPLGPQWSLSVGSEESITKLPNGNATLVSASGGQTTFGTTGKGGFASPSGDANLALSEVENAKKEIEFVLKDASSGATTRFIPTSSTSLWKPSKQEGPLSSQAVKYLYEPVGGVTEPKYALAPEPVGVTTCLSRLEKKEELVKGCRALEFKYDTSKTATGEGAKQWGEYVGRLKEVLFVAYSPATKTITKTPDADYLYDAQGRLRAEWNPQIEHELKTTYGYDTEQHVTSFTLPGQESWAFTYGTISGEPNTGRIIKATQAQASVPLWKGESPTSTEQPKVSGTAAIGGKLSVSAGVWGNEPVAYGYQWEDCNLEGKECTAIPGATNANYSPSGRDVGKTLVVNVTGTNGGGSLVVTSTKSSSVTATPVEYALPAEREPNFITAGPDGNLWYTETGFGKVADLGKMTTSGTFTEYAATGIWDNGITEGPDKKLWYLSELFQDVVTSNTSGGQTAYSYKEGYAQHITNGPNGNLWFTLSTGGIDEMTTAGVLTQFAIPAGNEQLNGITAGPDGNLWFTGASGETASKIGKITPTGVTTEYELPAKSFPEGITAGPDGNLWYVDALSGKIGKITTAGVITEYALPAGSAPYNITSGPEGNLWFTEVNNKIGVITTSGAITEFAVPAGSEPYGITVGPDKNIWYTDRKSGKIGKITLSGITSEPGTPQPGWTVEYKVPVSGTGAPYAMGPAETATWGQTADKPTEGIAIFPPDEPQTWPATNYKRATISYLDIQGRAVNQIAPGGGIATSEYNNYNDVVRTLLPDNRATALAAKEKSAEVAKELSTESTYAESGSEPGTELLSTLGPKHNVGLTNGTQAEAREHTIYTYNEGAPAEGGPYHLVTTTTEGAKIAGYEQEEDVRTTKNSYSGQSNLGWKLRKPTSVTTDPTGLDLVHTTEYEPSTGNVTETKMPAASGKDAAVPPTYSSSFGSYGSGNGQFNGPESVALNSAGDMWVTDWINDRVEEFNPAGEYLRKFGKEGTGNGEFNHPWGIAINQSTGNLYVSDFVNDRVQEFTATGEFIRTFGSKGTGNGQFEDPQGIAIESGGNLWVVD